MLYKRQKGMVAFIAVHKVNVFINILLKYMHMDIVNIPNAVLLFEVRRNLEPTYTLLVKNSAQAMWSHNTINFLVLGQFEKLFFGMARTSQIKITDREMLTISLFIKGLCIFNKFEFEGSYVQMSLYFYHLLTSCFY